MSKNILEKIISVLNEDKWEKDDDLYGTPGAITNGKYIIFKPILVKKYNQEGFGSLDDDPKHFVVSYNLSNIYPFFL